MGRYSGVEVVKKDMLGITLGHERAFVVSGSVR
jgi:hypothetical protein